jgi:hypothetical protein
MDDLEQRVYRAFGLDPNSPANQEAIADAERASEIRLAVERERQDFIRDVFIPDCKRLQKVLLPE